MYSGKTPIDRVQKWDLRFLELCKHITGWSKDPSTQVASVIVKDTNKIISVGYNGYAAGVDDDDTLQTREEKYPRIIHGEKNAILFAQRDLTGCTIYVYPLAPCGQCAAAICQVGISRVVTVIPNDPDRILRWESSNNVALDQFRKKGVDIVFYPEDAVV